MAGKSTGSGPLGNWAAIAAVLVLGTYFFNSVNQPFQGSRPAASGNVQRSLAETQDVDARLWQDPFGAVRKDVENQEKAKQKSGCHSGPSCLGLGPEDNTLILGVMLPGSSYSESEELRRQIRYAVLSSLGTQDYGPLDSEHIGYFSFQPDNSNMQATGAKCPAPAAAASKAAAAKKADADTQAATTTNIAYEQFAKLGNSAITSKLFVLWLNEDDLLTITKSCPLWGLSALQDALQRPGRLDDHAAIHGTTAGQGAPQTHASQTTIQFLGPGSSRTLQSMIVEAAQDGICKTNSQQNKQANPRNLALYNFMATAKETELQTAECQNQTVSNFFRSAGISYYRTIADDELLAEALIDELEHRGVPMACDSQDRVVLISEWDTAYGQTFRDSIRAAYMKVAKEKGYQCTLQNGAERFVAFSYMRGLDGRLPESQARANTDSGNNRSDTGAADRQAPGPEQVLNLYAASPKIERPEGNAQYDYLRRLGMELNERLLATNGGKIRAIGVVGSDIYDKLAVLQQLHPQFPGTIFFTTDLDARLYHPAQAEWARNLIVASSYDLEVDPKLQKDIPPFRSGYQTAAFLATRLALEDQANCHPESREGPEPKENKDPACDSPLKWAEQPKLFQIPYRRLFAQPLQTDAESSADEASPLRTRTSVARPMKGLFPPLPSEDWGSRTVASFLLGCLFFGVGLTFSQNFRAVVSITPAPKRGAWQRWGMLGVLALATVGVPMLLVPSIRLAVTQPLLWIGVGSVLDDAAAGPQSLTVANESKTWVGYLQCGLTVALCGLGGFFYYCYWPDIAAALTSHGDGEPILLLSGISAWPSLAIRLIAIALCLKFIGDVIRRQDVNLAGLANDFGLNRVKADRDKDHLEKAGPDRTADGIVDAIEQTLRGFFGQERMFSPRDIFSYRLWDKDTQRAKKETPHKISLVWKNYRRHGSTPPRFARIVTFAVLCVLFQVLLYVLLEDWPQFVGRGNLVQTSERFIFWSETILLWVLVVYVADATLLCLSFIREMQGFRSIWPPCSEYKPDSEWKDIEFVGKRTDCIAKLIPYPFLILTLLILAQSPLIDDMPRDWPRLIEMGVAFGVIVSCAVMLPIEAQKLRDVALTRLSQAKSVPHTTAPLAAVRIALDKLSQNKAAADQANADDCAPEKIDSLIHKIQEYREGAFTPLPQQPIVQALLYPLSGIGGTALLQYLVLPGL